MMTGDLRKRTLTGQLDVKAIQKGHQNESKDKARRNLESISYDIQESEQFVDYVTGFTASMSRMKGGFRWLYLVLVGLGAGSVAVMIQFILKNLNEWKFETQEQLCEAGNGILQRYFVWIGTCLALAIMAGICVCYVEPLAAGSGIPEIKCILNGIDVPNVLRLKTLVAKAFGIVCSVAAGLPCGKEGPMIHSGAIVAAQATRASAGPLKAPYRMATEARDFVAAGAAAGVAAAFGAPIGGVLFAVEEGASHMSPVILVRAFVCAAVSALTVRFFAGPMDGAAPWGTLGTDVPVEFGRFDSRMYKIWELPIFAMMGIGGGLAGALFNGLNTQLSKWRMRHIGPRGHLRFAEVIFVTLTIVSFNFFAPMAMGGETEMHKFDPAQKLFVDVGGEAIRELFHGTENLDVTMLLFFAVVHYVQTCWTYGLGVPSGLFVPSLLGGAAFGRIIGQLMQGVGGLDATRPGMYALVGATAMLSGMARITISLVVILMETTGEAEWGVPIFLVVMAAKWTGDIFNKGIYDIHIELKHVPVLENRPEKLTLSWQASDIMATGVMTMPVMATPREILNTLEGCRHAAFPVVGSNNRFVGLVDRNTLLHVLKLGAVHDVFQETPAGLASSTSMVPFKAMIRHGHPRSPPIADVKAALSPGETEMLLDLVPYTNRGCYTVQSHAAALRCHLLFRTMGLRHLPVLAEDNTIVGIITRKDLIGSAETAEHVRSMSRSKSLNQCESASNNSDDEQDDSDQDESTEAGALAS